MKKIVSGLLSLVMVIGVLPSVYAEGISTAGGTGSVPVTLTAEPLTFSVTVPTSLPVTVNAAGEVSVAETAKIANNGAGPVKVENVAVEAISPWSLAEYGDLSGEKVGTKKFGMAIQGTGVSTDGSCSATFDSIPAKGEIGLEYGAYVAPQNTEISGVGIANVVFTVGWDEYVPIVYQDFEVTRDNRAAVGYTGAEGENLVIPATFVGDGNNGTTAGVNYKVTSLGDLSFVNCPSLTSITIPDSVTSIGDFAFSDCRSLTLISIPNSVTSIGQSAFGDCFSLTSITIPDSVISIGQTVFNYCVKLTSITYKGTTYNSVDEFKTAFNAIEGNNMA